MSANLAAEADGIVCQTNSKTSRFSFIISKLNGIIKGKECNINKVISSTRKSQNFTVNIIAPPSPSWSTDVG